MANNYGYVEVNFTILDKSISEIEKYIEQLKKNMATAQNEIDILMQNCSGPDMEQFEKQWDKAVDNGSTYSKFCKSLESYVSFLKYVKMEYKYIQSRAVNTANGL